jgi:hypothetical protein
MSQRSSVYLGIGLIALAGSVLVVVSIWRNESTNIVIGASILMMAGASLTALTASSDSD